MSKRSGDAKVRVRDIVKLTERKFDTKTLPADMQRIFKVLKKERGEEQALAVMFTIRTAVGLHRAWHMSLLTNKICEQLKTKFRLRMNWRMGVLKLQFKIADGGFELYRKVPYDYDSEYQDIFMRIAIALMDGEINIHEAMIYQSETQQGLHTAKSGLFLRDYPGRLVLYPLVSATCAVIFFNGDWTDFGIAALTGLATGVSEMVVGMLNVGILNDIFAGTVTGLIGGMWYRFIDDEICLSSIFLGTLYWFFYGTAFVVGILEIIAGELETGVTRFIAVAVKTFVLCLGASFGLLVSGNAAETWYEQADNCGKIDLDAQWWRVPLYLLCSVAVLGQYRFPIVRYWRALVTMVVGYEVQYQSFNFFATLYDRDNLDTAISNVFGCAAAVISACGLAYYIGQVRYYYDARILEPEAERTAFGNLVHAFFAFATKTENMVGLGRTSDRLKLSMEKSLAQSQRELNDPEHERQEIPLNAEETNLIVETIVGSQDMNIWSIMMPALYQLVPGSMIAKLWFNYIFPPRLIETETKIEGTEFSFTSYEIDQAANNVFAGLMIISTSLALGLIVGFALVQIFEAVCNVFNCFQDNTKNDEKMQRAKSRRAGMYSAPTTKEENPQSVAEEFHNAIVGGVNTVAEADAIFNAVDIDQSGTIDEEEVTYYMHKAGLSRDQIKKLFASMDKDGSGEVERAEFRAAMLDKGNASLLEPEEKGPVEESPILYEKEPTTGDASSEKSETPDETPVEKPKEKGDENLATVDSVIEEA